MDILVKPMQRLTKYSLLLKAIHKKTEDEVHKPALIEMVIGSSSSFNASNPFHHNRIAAHFLKTNKLQRKK